MPNKPHTLEELHDEAVNILVRYGLEIGDATRIFGLIEEAHALGLQDILERVETDVINVKTETYIHDQSGDMNTILRAMDDLRTQQRLALAKLKPTASQEVG